MSTITIYVEKETLDFIRDALNSRHESLMTYLNLCEEQAKKINEEKTAKEFEFVFPQEFAPWGLKNDGTPKKKPGRQPKGPF
jgi:hypothetical protein